MLINCESLFFKEEIRDSIKFIFFFSFINSITSFLKSRLRSSVRWRHLAGGIVIPISSPDCLQPFLKNIHTLLTVEEHFIEGGLGSIISDWILKDKLTFRLKKLGIKNEFIHAIKNYAGMRMKYGISAQKIRDVIMEAFKHE